MNILCRVVGHYRKPERAWHDGLDWRANCTRCATPLIKDPMTRAWREFDRERDFDCARRGKPSHERQ